LPPSSGTGKLRGENTHINTLYLLPSSILANDLVFGLLCASTIEINVVPLLGLQKSVSID
jgi:hypothetical protein